MKSRMEDLQRYEATSGDRNFTESIKTSIFFEAILARDNGRN